MANAKPASPSIGIVVIGRNEGDRLRQCLESLRAVDAPIVYVDSGSTDASVALAASSGAAVVELDPARPFTAARARNTGFARLREARPDLDYVQFIDGDCLLAPGWLEAAIAALEANAKVAVVCGRRRERAPERSVYNLLCDMEWNTAVGETSACGGDAMMRAAALSAVGGFRESLIAGEEPELCFRLRQSGCKVLRLDEDMTLHDAAMSQFGQWWRRTMRAGHAYAEGYALHGNSPERYNAHPVGSAFVWGGAIPVLTIILALAWTPWWLLLLLAYPALAWRIWRFCRSRGDPPREACLYAEFCLLGKFAELTGAVRYWTGRLRNRNPELIEYKERFTDRP
jgi:GT2 family glycosyltransferase